MPISPKTGSIPFKSFAHQHSGNCNVKSSGQASARPEMMSYGRYGKTYVSAPTESSHSAEFNPVETASKYRKAASVMESVHDALELKEKGRIPYILEKIKDSVDKMFVIAEPYLDHVSKQLKTAFTEVHTVLKEAANTLMQNRRQFSLKDLEGVISTVKSCWNRFFPLAKTCFESIVKKISDTKGQLISKISSFFTLESKFRKVITYLSKLDKLPILGDLISGAEIELARRDFEKNPTIENHQKYDNKINSFFVDLCRDLLLAGALVLVGVITWTFGTIVLCLLICALIGYAVYDVYKSFTDDKYQEFFTQSVTDHFGSTTDNIADVIVSLQFSAQQASDNAIRKFTELENYLDQKIDQIKGLLGKIDEIVTENIDDAILYTRDKVQMVKDKENEFINSHLGQQIGDFLEKTMPGV